MPLIGQAFVVFPTINLALWPSPELSSVESCPFSYAALSFPHAKAFLPVDKMSATVLPSMKCGLYADIIITVS